MIAYPLKPMKRMTGIRVMSSDSGNYNKGVLMTVKAHISPGICKFNAVVKAETKDSQNVTFEFVSECEIIAEFDRQVQEISPVDAFMTLGPEENPILSIAGELLQTKGCCDACVVPAGTVKIMQVAANLALSEDVSIEITRE